MDKLSRLVGAISCAAVVALAACSGNSSVTPTTGTPGMQSQAMHGGQFSPNGFGVGKPVYMRTRFSASPNVQPDILLNYSNGPVLGKPKMYLIFWGFKANKDPDKIKPLLISYAKSIGGTPYNNIYTQYYGPGTVYILNPNSQFGGAFADNTNAIPAHPTDSQVAAESLVGVQHFGYNANASYVVVTAHNHSTIGFGSSWCAYHSATSTNGQLVSYTNLPYMPDAGGNCGANFLNPPPNDESATDEGVTIVEGHEYGESVTDPNPPSGWYNGQYGEIGDICAWQNIANDTFKNGHVYTAQPMFSNASQSCVHHYP